MNTARKAVFDPRTSYIKPMPTKATLGHSTRAATMLNAAQVG